MRYLKVWFRDDSFALVVEDDLGRLDAMVSAHVETSRDSLIHLTSVHGDEMAVRASYVEGWSMSSKETRRDEVAFEADRAEETAEFRAEFGVFE